MNELEHKKYQELAELYSLDALSKSEKEIFEEHLRTGCKECAELLNEMNTISNSLLYAQLEVQPPKSLKEKIFQSIDVEASNEVRSNEVLPNIYVQKNKWKNISLALGFALSIILVGALLFYSVYRTKIIELEKQIDISNTLIGDLENKLKEKDKVLEALQMPQLKIVDLKGLKVSPNSEAKVLMDPSKPNGVFYVYDLPQVPENKSYQLWMIKGNQPISAGIFTVDKNGKGFVEFKLQNTNELTAFAVTLEPAGGVPLPTGDMYLLGTISGS